MQEDERSSNSAPTHPKRTLNAVDRQEEMSEALQSQVWLASTILIHAEKTILAGESPSTPLPTTQLSLSGRASFSQT